LPGPLLIRLITPAPPRSRKGNRITALRWAGLLRGLGHRVTLEEEYRGGDCDLLVVLHARRSFPSARLFHRLHPGLPLVVALTGTDLYRDLPRSARARQALEWARRIVVLQKLALAELPPTLRARARVIHQSALAAGKKPRRREEAFEVCVLGHLRAVKDPFRAAEASRLLPDTSRVQVLQAGGALDRTMALRARREEAANPRYRWLGELPRWKALRVLARSRLLVLSSILEGGANVISEALASSVPVLSSRIPGSVGLLGRDYPGYFPPGDTRALARLLKRAEADPAFYRRLEGRCRELAGLADPAREKRSWRRLLAELGSRQGIATSSV
jgi:putative glycosyltransferase (TIGR04348 family)